MKRHNGLEHLNHWMVGGFEVGVENALSFCFEGILQMHIATLGVYYELKILGARTFFLHPNGQLFSLGRNIKIGWIVKKERRVLI